MTPSTPMTRNQPTMTGPNRRPMLAVPRRCIMNSPIRIAKCPLSGSAPGADRSHWRTSACHVRQHALFHRTYQGRQAAPFGGDRQGLADGPTLGDFVPGFETSAWAGIGAPKNTPAEIIDTLNREINAALADATIKARFAELGGEVFALSPSEYGKRIAEETEKW